MSQSPPLGLWPGGYKAENRALYESVQHTLGSFILHQNVTRHHLFFERMYTMVQFEVGGNFT